MPTDFATAMRRALAETRAGNLGKATRTIKMALTGGQKRQEPAQPKPNKPGHRIVPSAEEAEIVPSRMAATPRKSLRTVVAGLHKPRTGGPEAGFDQPPKPSSIPEGALYEWRNFGCSAGARDYRLYVPASLAGRAQGLVIMLHGCTQSPDDFATGTRMNEMAERHRLVIAYPCQTKANNPASCWNWFQSGDQARDAGEPAILAGITRELMQEFHIDGARVMAAGLSAGGAMAAILGQSYPDLFPVIGVHSGLPAGAAHDAVSAFAAMGGKAKTVAAAQIPDGVRTIVFHGTADATVHPSNGAQVIANARNGRTGVATVTQAGVPNGHSFSRSIVTGPNGCPTSEYWQIERSGHAWSGGAPDGTYTDPAGPDASSEMVRFLLAPFTSAAR